MPNPYHDPEDGRFTTKSGAGAGFGAKDPDTGSLNAADAKGQGVEKMWGVKATGRKVKDRSGKMVPEYDFSERANYVDQKLNSWRFHKDADGNDDPIDTKNMYSIEVDGEKQYAPWRRKQQKEVIDYLWNKYAKDVPNEGKAIMAGGLGGAGKGTTLGNLGIAPESPDYFTINPDDIKEEMAKRGMIPILDKKMTLMELSPLAHEEASDMAGALAEKAYKEKKNVIWDFTMSTEKSVVTRRIDPMRAAGYTDIKAVFVDVTVDKSVKQAQGRWQGGLVHYGDRGGGMGGRFLPSTATEENQPQPGSKWRSKNRETFENIKGELDGYIVYDNEHESTVVDSKNAKGIGNYSG